MLQSIGILSEEEAGSLVREMKAIYPLAKQGDFTIEEGVEDVHSQLEKLLTDRLGDAGKKVHTGRSRNDQVLVDLHLYLRDSVQEIVESAGELFQTLIDLSEKYSDYLLPGYTHFQVAMPASFGVWFGAYAEDLTDDMLVALTAYRMANQNPLGSAAGFGTTIPLDRRMTTELLGFADLRYNVMHAMMSRGKLEKSISQGLSAYAGTLSRLAMDICLYMSQNFAFISFPDEITTGSSIMPHKKNPDVFELIRAKCIRIKALPNDVELVVSNLPSGYHRDFQVLKELIIPSTGELQNCLYMMNSMIQRIIIKRDILEDSKYRYIYSVDEVNKKVQEGIPFREAYKQVAGDIESGEFSATAGNIHVHEGGIGKLCNKEIRDKMNDRLKEFNFNRKDIAVENLLKT